MEIDLLNVFVQTMFFAGVVLVPVLGYWLGILDIRAHLRMLKGVLVKVSRVFHDEQKVPDWVQNEVHPSFHALGIYGPCTEDEVKEAYRKLAKKNHPDLGGDIHHFLRLQEHFENALYIVRTNAKR